MQLNFIEQWKSRRRVDHLLGIIENRLLVPLEKMDEFDRSFMTATIMYLGVVVVGLNDTRHNKELKENVFNLQTAWGLLLKQ